MNNIIPATASKYTVPITALPAGQTVAAQVYLSSDSAGLTQVGNTGALSSNYSSGTQQNVVCPMTPPSNANGLYVWVVVYLNGQFYATFNQQNTVSVGSVTVGQGTWS